MGCHCHCRSNFDWPPSNAHAPTVSNMRWRSPVAVSSSPSLLAKPLCDSSRQPLGSIPQHQVPIRNLPSQLYAFSTAGPQPQALTSGNSSNLSSMIVMDCTMMALITKNALLGVHLSQHQTQRTPFHGGHGQFLPPHLLGYCWAPPPESGFYQQRHGAPISRRPLPCNRSVDKRGGGGLPEIASRR